MTKRIHEARFALASDGTVLLNVGEFDGERNLEAVLRRAKRQAGPVFVGVEMRADERLFTRDALRSAYAEAAAYIIGGRQYSQRRRGRPGLTKRG